MSKSDPVTFVTNGSTQASLRIGGIKDDEGKSIKGLKFHGTTMTVPADVAAFVRKDPRCGTEPQHLFRELKRGDSVASQEQKPGDGTQAKVEQQQAPPADPNAASSTIVNPPKVKRGGRGKKAGA